MDFRCFDGRTCVCVDPFDVVRTPTDLSCVLHVSMLVTRRDKGRPEDKDGSAATTR